MKPARASGRGAARWIALGLAGLLVAFLGWELSSLPWPEDLERLRSGPVRDTAMMRTRMREAADQGRPLRIRQTWVELSAISPAAVRAILSSEDARFFAHDGIDLREINEAILDTVENGGKLRGASTLTQQLAKNLYLSGERSLLRKAKEAWLATQLEEKLSKKRILTLYLNIAEWGDGVFGIEAAAQAHLGKHASELSLADGAALAAMLPNPHRFDPKHPALLRRRAARVLDRVLADRVATRDEVASAADRLDRWLGPLGATDD